MRETCNQYDRADYDRANEIEIENYKVSQYQEIIQINREIEEQNRLKKWIETSTSNKIHRIDTTRKEIRNSKNNIS